MTSFHVKSFSGCLHIHVLLLLAMLVSASLPAMAGDDEADVAPSSRYVEIKPAFVTNYGNMGRLRYMKVQVTLRVLGTAGEAQVNHHMPYIKDTLLTLFAVQTQESIGTAQGKEALRKKALESVNGILEEEDEASHVEDLLFTSFVAHG